MTRLTVSYDVFDAVVTRTFAHPRDVFVRLGELLRERRCVADARAFAEARWVAELETRKRTQFNEVQLEEIYRAVAPKLGWDEATARTAADLELELEARNLRAVPGMAAEVARARARAGRVLFLSDMYLSAEVLRGWLQDVGILEPPDLVFVSGDRRANKSSGRLYQAARDATGGDFAHWEHAGDHPFADVEKPRALGIRATHLPRVHLTARERLARGTTGEFAPPWRSFLAGAMRLARLEDNAPDARSRLLWETGASVAGPLFYGFVRWVLAEAQRRGITRLYFLARDGQIFWRIAGLVRAAGETAIECRYLHASRLLFAGPAELSRPEMLRDLVAPTGHFHSLRQSLRHVGLEPDKVALPPPLRALPPDANLTPAQREQVAQWLLAPAQADLLRDAIDRRADVTRRYLEAEGLAAGSVGIVDAGWLGSSQKNLERILGHDAAPRPLTGFYLGLMPPRDPPAAGEMVGYANTFQPLPLVFDESHKVLIELMAQSDHGQVEGLTERDGTFAPVLRDPGPVDLEAIRRFQHAILAFTRRMLEVRGEAPVPWDEFARVVLAGYRRFHARPTLDEVRLFGALPHADQLFEQQHATLCAPMSTRAVLAALADYRRRPPHWWIHGQARLGHGPLLRVFLWLKAARWKLGGRLL